MSDFTNDLRKIDAPHAVVRGDDHQVVPIGARTELWSELVTASPLTGLLRCFVRPVRHFLRSMQLGSVALHPPPEGSFRGALGSVDPDEPSRLTGLLSDP